MEMSASIAELAVALSKAQATMPPAIKDSANPFFKSRYADLESVWEACRKPLTDQGLAIVQSPSAEGTRVTVETVLTHTSGQWVGGKASATAKDDSPQAIGSAITYLRRYALQSFAGVAPADDDGEAATAHGKSNGKAHDFAPAPSASRPRPSPQATSTTTVKAIDVKKGTTTGGKPYTLYVVTFADGRSGTTFKDDMALACESAKARGAQVDPVLTPSKRAGKFDLIELDLQTDRAEAPSSFPGDDEPRAF